MPSKFAPDLLYARDVAVLFGVDPKTISRWANEGKLPFQTTLGGHRRFPRKEIEALLKKGRSR